MTSNKSDYQKALEIIAKNLRKEAQEVANKKQPEYTEVERIDRKETSLLSKAQFKLDADKGMYANMQGFLDTNFDTKKYKGKTQITSGKVIYEDKTHITEIIFEGNFEVIGSYNFTAQTEKIKDALEEILVTQYKETQSPTIFINIKQLADEVGIRVDNLKKKIIYVMESLQTIRQSYTTKGKQTNTYKSFGTLRIISSSEYDANTGILEVNFDNKYAYVLTTHNFFQLPKKYRKINDNTFPYFYPLAKYIYSLAMYNNRNKITFKSLYEQVTKIPRIEDIRKSGHGATDRIYEPLQKHFAELNKLEDFIIAFENDNFLITGKGNKNVDFDKMLETNIIIKWKNKPNYEKLNQTKQKYKDKIIKEREKQIAKAMNTTSII